MAATADLMQRRPLRDLRVAEIGQLAAVSSSTFYLYFESVSDAGLAAVEEIQQATPEIMAVLESEWTIDNVLAKARAFVQAHVAVWDAHSALLQIRNFVADEGDRRFFDVRRRAVEPIHFGLQKKIETLQVDLPAAARLHPPSTASTILALLERAGALVRLPSAHRATRPGQIEAAVFMVACAVAGQAPTEGQVKPRRIRKAVIAPTERTALRRKRDVKDAVG